MDDRTISEKLRQWELEWCNHVPRHVMETLASMARYRRPFTGRNLLMGLASNDVTDLVTKAAKDLAHRFGY